MVIPQRSSITSAPGPARFSRTTPESPAFSQNPRRAGGPPPDMPRVRIAGKITGRNSDLPQRPSRLASQPRPAPAYSPNHREAGVPPVPCRGKENDESEISANAGKPGRGNGICRACGGARAPAAPITGGMDSEGIEHPYWRCQNRDFRRPTHGIGHTKGPKHSSGPRLGTHSRPLVEAAGVYPSGGESPD